jgi:hypothetical protein
MGHSLKQVGLGSMSSTQFPATLRHLIPGWNSNGMANFETSVRHCRFNVSFSLREAVSISVRKLSQRS